jgi:hypothetical protein
VTELLSLLPLLLNAAEKAHAMASRAATDAAFVQLLRAAEHNAATLTRVEEKVDRLCGAALQRGLAEIEDALANGRTKTQRRAMLERARESFKDATFASPEAVHRSVASMLCALSWAVLGHPEDAGRWARRACDIGDTAVNEELRVPPPNPAPDPPDGLTERIERFVERYSDDGPRLTFNQRIALEEYRREREAAVTTAIATYRTAQLFARAFDPSLPPFPTTVFIEGQVLDVHSETLPVTGTVLRPERATFRRDWPGSVTGQCEITFVAVSAGTVAADWVEVGRAVAVAPEEPWTPEKDCDTATVGGSSPPHSGDGSTVVVAVGDTVTLIAEEVRCWWTDATTPAHIGVGTVIAGRPGSEGPEGRRVAVTRCPLTVGRVRHSSKPEPPPEPTPSTPERDYPSDADIIFWSHPQI